MEAVSYKKLHWVALVVIIVLLAVIVSGAGIAQTSVPCNLIAEGNYIYSWHSYSDNGVWLTCKYKRGKFRPPN